MVQNLDKYLLAGIILFIDQFTKTLVKTTTRNYGAAFSIFKGGKALFIVVSVIVAIICIYYLNQKVRSKYRDLLYFGLSFILAGSLGNLIDRVVFGYVRDFIDFWVWPSFNIADAFNVIGYVLMVIFFIKKKP